MNQLGLPFVLNAKLLLSNFMGQGNQQAVSFIKNLLAQTSSNVVYITGAKSSGKTHFLQGCALAALEQNLNAIYIDFKQDFKQDLPADIFNIVATADWICIDNIEYLNNNQARELFDLYNKIKLGGQKLIVSSQYLPYDLELIKDLKTRLSQALIFSLQPLSDKDKIRVLENKTGAKNLTIDTKIYTYLFKYYSRDLSKILRLLKVLEQRSLQEKTKINISLIKKVID